MVFSPRYATDTESLTAERYVAVPKEPSEALQRQRSDRPGGPVRATGDTRQDFLRDRDRSPERWFCEKQGFEIKNGAMRVS
jgi:hypothetical protein